MVSTALPTIRDTAFLRRLKAVASSLAVITTRSGCFRPAILMPLSLVCLTTPSARLILFALIPFLRLASTNG